ncbi:DUF748 domain-containing protein [Vibrio rumoiensis]|uniref:Uncharacterized protein n=1 Tax=Vibrio rumoiensis 1S-45 TaxID=1188252 RepID=A0A1E5E2H3_9VIBR|nr:DUF748 domain-containing protein [Vibrio rumoiensis]OEF25736.1 hypothetical protein A1QC_08190 [Vibrio rumoiensis 1S-45]
MLSALKKTYQRFKQAPTTVRVLTYLGCTYAGYALILGLIIPAVAQSQAPKMLSELLGRNVNVEKVSINPFLLRVRIDGFDIRESNIKHSFVRFDQLDVQVGFWQSLLNLTPTVDHLYLVKPQVNISRLNHSAGFNFTDILNTLAKNSTPAPQDEPQTESSGLPAFRANDIQLSQGLFDFRDEPTGAHLKYQGLNINLPKLDSQALVTQMAPVSAQADKVVSASASNLQKSTSDNHKTTSNQNHFAINVTGADNGKLSLEGQFQLQPFAINGKLAMNNITLANFWPFAEKQLQAKLVSGKINFATHFKASEEPNQFDYSTDKGSFELLNLAFDADNQPKIKLPRLALDNIALNSQKQVVDIDALNIEGLWVDALLNKDGIDLQSLFTPKEDATASNANSPKKSTESDEASIETSKTTDTNSAQNNQAPSWLVRLHTFSMKDTDINVNEKMVSNGVHWRVYPLSISTDEVLSDLSKPIKYNVDLSVNSWIKAQPEQPRGSFSSSGSIDAKKLTFNGDVNLSKLDLSQFQTYLDPYLNVKLQSGLLSTKGNYAADTKGNATYSGQANISNLLVRDRLENQPLVKWADMGISSLQFDLAKQHLKIGTIAFNAPYSKVLIDRNRQTNIGSLVKAQPNTAKGNNAKKANASSKTASKPFAVDIGQITIKNGSTYFADYSLTPSFASGIELLNGSIKNLSSTPGTKATVNLNGKIDKYAPVTLKGAVNPLIKNPYLDLDLIIKSVELTSVNPYSGTYAGYYIDKGQLSLTLKYQLENNQLVGENHVVIDQLKLGEPSKSDLATSLPLSLAIAILQDRHGVIDLGVQVSGDVNKPDFSFGSVIWGAFVNVLTKAVTSPFSMLASLAGSDQELNRIDYEVGKSTLSDTEKDKLAMLAKALDDRPMLKLSIVGSVSEAEDSRAIAEEKLQNLLLKESGDAALPENLTASRFPQDGDLVDALEDLFEDQLKKDVDDEQDKIEKQIQTETGKKDVDDTQLTTALHISMYNQLVDAQNVIPDELGSLAEARARTIKAYLVDEQQVDPARVFILDSTTKLKTEASAAELTLDAN